MLHLVYGCPGGGKSYFLANLISERLKKNKKVILIVPERFSVSAEQTVTGICKDRYKMNLDILSFKRLCNRVFREYGGLCYNYAGKGGRVLMMYRALCSVRKELKTYRNLELRDSGTVQAMLDSIVSFKRAALTPELFENAAKNCEKDRQLCGKISDLAKIWKEYDRLLGERYDDPEEDLTRLSSLLSEHCFFADKEVFVDSASAFTGQELNILKAALVQSPHVTVALGFLPDDERPLFKKLRWCRDLLTDAAEREGVPVERLAVFGKPYKKSEDLVVLEKWLYDETEKYKGNENNIHADCFENIYEECKAIAARIIRDVQSGGRYMDHGVVVRNLDGYKGIIDQVFEANGLPYTMTDKVCLANRGAGRLILSALRLLMGDFRSEDLFDYMKTGFCTLSDEECFLLEDYVNLWRIEGRKRWFSEDGFAMNPGGHLSKRGEEDLKKLEKINEVRKKLITPLKQLYEDFSACADIEDFAEALFEYILCMNLEDALSKEAGKAAAAGDLREEQFHLQTYKALCDTLDELVYTMGDLPCKAEELPMIFEILFEKKELGSIPPGKDRVLVSDAFNLSPGGVRILHVAGMNEGVFPAFSRRGGIFTSRETQVLRELRIDLPGNEERAIYDEEYLCYSVLTLPSKTLYVSCYRKDLRGNACKSSELFDNLCAFGVSEKEGQNERRKKEDFLFGRANCLEKALQKEEGIKGRALKDYFSEKYRLSLENAGRAPLVVTVDALSPERTKELYKGGVLRLSRTRLEDFVGCPFGYTCRYILKLREKTGEDTGANEVGTLVHLVFEKLVEDCIREGQKFGEVSDGQLLERVEQILKEGKEQMLGGAEEDVLVGQLFKRIGQSTKILAMNLRDEFEQSKFEPAFCELSFGLGERGEKFSLPEVCTQGENRVALSGTADRVDVFRKDGKIYLRVVDYKTGNKEFDLAAVNEGMDLQLLLYLKALKKCRDPEFLRRLGLKEEEEVLPAGVLYFIAKNNSIGVDRVLDAAQTREKIRMSIRRSGLLIDDPEVLEAMEKGHGGNYIPNTVEKKKPAISVIPLGAFEEKLDGLDRTLSDIAGDIRKGRADAAPSGDDRSKGVCTYCPMKPICRAKAEKVEEEE